MSLVIGAIGTVMFTSLLLLRDTLKTNLLGEYLHKFEKLFYEIDLSNNSGDNPTLIDVNKGKYCTKFTVELPIGLSVDDIKKYEESFSSLLECENVTVEKQSNSKFIDITHMHNQPKVKYNPLEHKRNDFLIPLGIDLYKGENFFLDIFKDSNANILVCSSPGLGKSNIVNLILGHFANNFGVDDIQFAINDSKVIDLPIFKKCKNTISYYSGTHHIHKFLDKELEEMECRYKLLERYGLRNIRDLRNTGNKIPFRVVVIEEVSSFAKDELFEQKLSDLISKGRAAGIVVILITQTPTYDVVPTRIKNCVNTCIGLKVKNMVSSEIIMNDAELHKLSGSGHCKVTDSTNYNTEVQSYRMTDECLESIINNNK